MFDTFSFVLLRAPLQSLKKAYEHPGEISGLLKEGIYLSSPEFLEEFEKKENLSADKKEKLKLSFLKYWLRSCSRCTPYGTFAGSALLDIKDEPTKIVLSDPEKHLKHARLDMNYITAIITALVKDPLISKQIKFFTNNSLYETAESFRYAEYSVRNNLRHYELISLEKNSYTQLVLQKALTGATIQSLINILTQQEDADENEAAEFIAGMIDSQILISELEPCVTGIDPLDHLIIQLEQLNGIEALTMQLKKIQLVLHEANANEKYYKCAEEELDKLEPAATKPKNIFQTDLFLSVEKNSISKKIIKSILQQTEELSFLNQPYRNKDLEDFKKKFLSKYEEEEIELNIALDAESGIGYAGIFEDSTGNHLLINDLAVKQIKADLNYAIGNIQEYIIYKYAEALKLNSSIIEIKEDEIKKFNTVLNDSILPNSLYLMGSLLKDDEKEFVFDITGSGGPSAGNLLARFTHGDAALCSLTKEILSAEERQSPDVIFAEIVHLPEARIGNVLLRPLLRKYELPYVGKSGALTDDQILMSDLMISINQNQILLRSKKHNKRIIPRLTSAHNFSHRSLPVYKFLCDLQMQEKALPPAWDWNILDSQKFLPRVVYKNLILKKARWKVDETDIKDLPKNKNNYVVYFELFRKKLQLPQTVTYIEADNKLLINFAKAEGIQLFLHYLKRFKNIILEEFLFNDNNCIVKDLTGHPFTNELIIPLYNTAALTEKKISFQPTDFHVKRKFIPNSEWLYFKIYCSPVSAEKLLQTVIYNFVENGIEDDLFEKFFFVRYKDEASHVRIRFYNSNIQKQFLVQEKFFNALQPYFGNNIISKIIIDTFSREIERYSADLINESETIFFYDSFAIIKFLHLLPENDAEKHRLLFALKQTDMLLADFGYSVADKRKLSGELQKNYFTEFSGDAVLQKQLNEKYRLFQQEIFIYMQPPISVENIVTESLEIFNERSLKNKDVIKNIFKKLQSKETSINTDQLISSYVHMSMNRLFIADQRKYELLVYFLLEKYYMSKIAINTKNKATELN